MNHQSWLKRARILAGSLLLLGFGTGCMAADTGADHDPVTRLEAPSHDACEDDSFEPNQSATAAIPIQVGEQLEAVSCHENVDFYTFQGPPAGTEFTVSLLFVSDDFEYGTDTGDLNALLRDQAGNLLFVGDREGKDNEFLPAVSDGGTYSLEIQSAQRTVPYTLAVTLGRLRCGILEDAFEPNDTLDEAVDVGSTPTLSGYICRGDSDFYRFQGPPSGQLVSIGFEHDPARGDLDARLYDASGTLVAQQSAAAPLRAPSSGGSYVLEVSGYGKSSGDYAVSFGAETPSCAADDDTFEPNDDVATAAELAFPSAIAGFMCDGNTEVFRFRGPELGVPFEIALTAETRVSVQVRDADGRVVYKRPSLSSAVIDLLSNGRDYYLELGNPSVYQLSRGSYALELRPQSGDRTCDLRGDLESLGRACAVANAGPIEALNLATLPDAPLVQAGRSYVLRLLPGTDPTTGLPQNTGRVRFTPAETGDYVVYTGSPGVALTVSEADTALDYGCTLSFSRSDCNKLLRGYRFSLEAGTTYDLDLGPAAVTSVRLGIERALAPSGTPSCAAGELRNVESTCTTAAISSTPVTAAPVGDPTAPALDSGTVYGVRLAAGAGGYGGVVRFTPELSGQYLVYFGTPNLPVRVLDETLEVAAACEAHLEAETCSPLRRVATYRFEAGHTYRLELGPVSGSSYLRLVIQPNLPVVGECNPSELPTLTELCVAGQYPYTVLEAPASGPTYSAPFLNLDTPALVHLTTTSSGNLGRVRLYPQESSRLTVYVGSHAVPLQLRQYDGSEVQPLCYVRLSSSSCSAYRAAYVYPVRPWSTYDATLGPAAPQEWVRLATTRPLETTEE